MIHLLHGIHSEGQATLVEQFLPLLSEFEVSYPDYGWILGAETRFVNPAIVGTLRPYIHSGDVLLCHSNGCTIAYELMQRGAPVAGAIFINAALERAIELPPQVGWLDVYYNAGDQITEAAQWGARFGLDDPAWGEMGHAGYQGADPRIHNIDGGATDGLPVLAGHSDLGSPAKFALWGPFVLSSLRKHLHA